MRPALALATALVVALAAPGATAPSGAELYRAHCAECHGATGAGEDGAAPDIRAAPRMALERALPGLGQMPGFVFSEVEIAAILAYLHALDR